MFVLGYLGLIALGLTTQLQPRIFWTMLLPLVPVAIVLMGFPNWRRICPLAFFGELGRKLNRGMQRRVPAWIEQRFFFVTFALLLPSAVLSDDNSLTKLLDSISVSLESTEPTYRFSYDPDFPCNITITHDSKQDTTRWLRRYRFELSDMTPGQLLVARDGRRAISYYGEKTTAGGEVTSYAPKKISAIQINTARNNGSGTDLQQRFDEAIRICEEKNRF